MTNVRLCVEVRAAEEIPASERAGSPRSQAWIWAATNVNPFVITYGFIVLKMGLAWPWAMVVVVIGCLAGYGLLGIVAASGPRAGRPTMSLGRRLFGATGNLVPNAVSSVSLVGWSAVNLVLAVLAAIVLASRLARVVGGYARFGGFAVVSAAVLGFAVLGFRSVMSIQRLVTFTSCGAVVGYILLTAGQLHIRLPTQAPQAAALAGGGIFVLAAGGLGWVMMGADYSRYLPQRSAAADVWGWMTAGGALPAVTLMSYGIMLGASHPELLLNATRDPVATLADWVPGWFVVPFLLATALGFANAAVVNLYSSGLSLLTLGFRCGRPAATVVNGGLALVASGYVVFVSPSFFETFESFESFLEIFGVPVAAWCGVYLAHIFRIINGSTGFRGNSADAVGNTAILLLASGVGFGLITSGHGVLGVFGGYLLTANAAHSAWGQAGLGIPVALVLGYLLSSICALRSARTWDG